MTDEEKEKYRGGLIATCKTYCHIDYDDDIEILELMLDTTLDEITPFYNYQNNRILYLVLKIQYHLFFFLILYLYQLHN